MAEQMIAIQGLRKAFSSIVAVDDISFTVGRGEVLGFLGPNGAGKSTTMKMITGFLTPDAGTVHVGGKNITAQPIAAKRQLGYLPEGAPLYGDMTTHGLLEFIAEIRGFKGTAKKQCIDEVIERVHLSGVLEQPVETLSKGFKRRVGLAQAILHNPHVLILDEPTDGLDPNQKHEVRLLIQEMAKDKAIILSTHILEEVDAVCSRAIIIAKGSIVSDGTPSELIARSPSHQNVVIKASSEAIAVMAKAIKALENVDTVEVYAQEDKPWLRAKPCQGSTISAEISQLLHQNSWHIDELRVERGKLDDVFREITMQHGVLS